MNIPTCIRIGGVDYKIINTSHLNDGTHMAYGRICYETSLIELNETIPSDEQFRGRILWHEILHGIADQANLKLEDEEHVIDTLAKGIYQVLQDNCAGLFDLKA